MARCLENLGTNTLAFRNLGNFDSHVLPGNILVRDHEQSLLRWIDISS